MWLVMSGSSSLSFLKDDFFNKSYKVGIEDCCIRLLGAWSEGFGKNWSTSLFVNPRSSNEATIKRKNSGSSLPRSISWNPELDQADILQSLLSLSPPHLPLFHLLRMPNCYLYHWSHPLWSMMPFQGFSGCGSSDFSPALDHQGHPSVSWTNYIACAPKGVCHLSNFSPLSLGNEQGKWQHHHPTDR